MYWKSEISPEAPITVESPTLSILSTFLNLASEPYEAIY